MFEKVWDFLHVASGGMIGEGDLLPESTDIDDFRLAITVVLLDVAFVDNEFDNREFKVIVEGLVKLLRTDREDIEELVQKARNLRAQEELDLDRVAEHLKAHLKVTERRKVYSLISEIVMADLSLHPFEKALRDRYEKLLLLSE